MSFLYVFSPKSHILNVEEKKLTGHCFEIDLLFIISFAFCVLTVEQL